MAERNAAIYVVDDDPSVSEAVRNLLESVGFQAHVFESTEEFMKAERPNMPSCLLLDVRLPGVSGLDFQDMLAKSGIRIPIVFITAHGDVPMTTRAMKAGAVDFLMKPFQKNELLSSIRQALERDRAAREEEAGISKLLGRFERLTKREREVMELVVSGLINKEVAAKLDLSEITVKVHRGNVMDKMKADSLADLVRMAERLKSKPSR